MMPCKPRGRLSSNFDDWSAGLTDRSRAFYRNNTPEGSNESINGEDGLAGTTLPYK